MASENEKVMDVLEEMRVCATAADPTIWGDARIAKLVITTKKQQLEYCDRLEAAWNRERESLLTKQRENVNSGSAVYTGYNKGGNAAAMREALLALSAWVKIVKDHPKDKTATECAEFVEQAVNAALSAPARNCDIHTDFNDAITTLADERNWHDGKWDSERYCILASWLLAPAAEQKGAST